MLLAFPGQRVAVQYFPSAGDARSYAKDFLTIFKAVGWNVNDAEPAERIADGTRSGLALLVSKITAVPSGAEALPRCVANLWN